LKWSVECHAQRPSEEQAAALPYISNEDIASWTGELLREEPEPSESDGRVFQRDDVLFNKLRPYLAKVYHAGFDGIGSGELLCLRSGDTVHPRFLFYVLVSKGFIDAVDSESFGTKMPRADWGIVGHQPLPLPPLETQRRIARFLDAKTAQIDALIAKKRALLKRLAEKRQAIITQAVTKGLDPAVPMKDSGIDWLGQIPAHWDLKRLRFAATNLNNLRVPIAAELRKGVDRTYPYYGASGIIDYVDEYIFDFSTVLVAEDGANLLSRSSPLAFAAHGKYWVNNHAHILKPTSMTIWYCAAVLALYPLEPQISGSAQPKLTKDRLMALPVWVPPLAEQEEIETKVLANTEPLGSAAGKLATTIDRLGEYRAALITAAVTGQLEIPANGLPDHQDEGLGTLAAEVA
jgi:type I restriction enzyme S subunit